MGREVKKVAEHEDERAVRIPDEVGMVPVRLEP